RTRHPGRDEERALTRLLERFWPLLDDAPRVLNHGDLCTENALWHDETVMALLDFEYVVIAPIAVDLNELVKIAFAPHRYHDLVPDPSGSGRAALQEIATEIAASELTMNSPQDLMIGYVASCVSSGMPVGLHARKVTELLEPPRPERKRMLT